MTIPLVNLTIITKLYLTEETVPHVLYTRHILCCHIESEQFVSKWGNKSNMADTAIISSPLDVSL